MRGVVLTIALVACRGGSTPRDDARLIAAVPVADAVTTNVARVDAAVDGGDVIGALDDQGRRVFVLKWDHTQIRVHLAIADWTYAWVWSSEHTTLSPSPVEAHVEIELRTQCGGECDENKVVSNMLRAARERFDFVRSKDHEPRLQLRWNSQPRAETPKLLSWRFTAVAPGGNGPDELHAAIIRVLDGGFVLECSGRIDTPRAFTPEYEAKLDHIAQICREAEIELR